MEFRGIGTAWCGTKEMMQPCPLYLHLISLVPRGRYAGLIRPVDVCEFLCIMTNSEVRAFPLAFHCH